MAAPLESIKVVDFTHLLPGELTAAVLCDLGADLTRIEKLTPGLAQHLPPIVNGESLYFWSVHRDEKRLGIDLKSSKGLEIVYKILSDADLLIENFRPGVMSRLGLGFGKIHKLNPRLIYCSISAYGQNNSYSLRPGHDLNLQAESGVLHVCRSPEGKPLMPGTLLSDYMTALLASISILAALLETSKSNKGRHLDISMFDSILWTQALAASASLYLEEEPKESDPCYRQELANYNVFRCLDGRYIAIAPLEPQFWQTFCRKLDKPEWLKILAFGIKPELRQQIEDLFAGQTLSHWLELFEGSDACISPVNTVKEALDSIPCRQRNLLQTLFHPALGKIPQLRTPLPFDKNHSGMLYANNDLGKSTGELMLSLGFSQAEIDALVQEGIVSGKVNAGR